MITTYTKTSEGHVKKILTMLKLGELSSAQLMQATDLSKPGLNAYMRRLVATGQVKVVGIGKGPSGRQKAYVYSLSDGATTEVKRDRKTYKPRAKKTTQSQQQRPEQKRSIASRLSEWLFGNKKSA